MHFSLHDFIESMCDEIRYKPIHRELKAEIKAHIEEMAEEYMAFGYDYDTSMNIAASRMGNAREIGEMMNKEYRMPFNSRLGLMFWAAIVTAVVYLGYPLIFRLYHGTIRIGHYNTVIIITMLALFMYANIRYLRRGRMMITVRDMLQISAGFIIGWVFSMLVLLISAKIMGLDTRYFYMPAVKIPLAFPYAPLLPKQYEIFGVEAFTWWFCMIAYMISVKSRKKIKPSLLVVNFMYLNGEMIETEDFINGVTPDGKVIRDGILAYLGLMTNKFGEKIRLRNNDEDIY